MDKLKADVLIVGGGVSGFAAAIAASYENKKVILLDKNKIIGGDSVNTNVGTICGAYIRSATPAQLVGYKFSESFLHVLQQKCEFAKPVHHNEGLYIIPYEWSALQTVYDEMLREHNVQVLRDAQLEKVVKENNIIGRFTANQNGKLYYIEANAVVDCSGSAAVSQLAKLETIHEDFYQAASQIFRLRGVESENEFSLNMALKRTALRKVKDEQWPMSYNSLSIVPGSLRDKRVDIKFTLPEAITDDDERNEQIGEYARDRVQDLFEVIRREVESLGHSSIEMIFPKPGIRVLKRSKGKYILTEDDILKCRKFDDSVATGTWPIEEWDNEGKLHMKFFPLNKSYSLPAGCLISDQVDNLYFAGKNISATTRAIASARVMGTGLQTGYAAGKLACSTTIEERNSIIASLYNELDKFQ
jgi:glycine/D-amino acid oxidase-like deaminating enzyme